MIYTQMGAFSSICRSVFSWFGMAAPPAAPPQPPPFEVDETDPDHVSYLRDLVLKYKFTNKELSYFLEVCL